MSSIADYALPNPINRNRSGIIGRAVDRYEGPLKVSGTAPYANEVETPSAPAYGALVAASIGCGQVTAVDDAAAKAAPGVLLVWHHFDPPTGQGGAGAKSYVQGQTVAEQLFVNPQVRYFGQPMGLVVADTLENAHAAAQLVRITYQETTGEFEFDPAKAGPAPNDEISHIGDFEAAFAAAPVQLDETYSTPIQNHCQMEPCATTAWWEGDKVIVHTSVQMVEAASASACRYAADSPRQGAGAVALHRRRRFGGKGSHV